ncbi:CvfB family protein [Arcobacter roscoffensis]|uniref:S1-like domain-containing RNA-binding protein n=1 Tax=Arcobacter roscoffensis TaxID=2961520 RepID=A0ABY5E6D2_9BACT|nr:S1-like domain-containing RNA-binding protein [Arcobacter roscoffensis]UTJ07182.1 S1-like domain-containing RNA-binding protein [Arcobacter roscoffensis]
MNEKIEVGKTNTLRVNRVTEFGLFLIAKNDEEVLLPNAYIDKSMEVDTFVDVFIYTDSEDRIVATTLKPYVYLNEFASLEVVDTARFGAFVDIGLSKDILVPKNKQRSSYTVGGYKVLQLELDERTNRLIANEKFTLEKNEEKFEQNDEVDILLYSKTPLGFKVIVNNKTEGMIFHNEIFENIKVGDRKKAYIKNVRTDGKLDISLQKIGKKISDDKVIELLKENGGFMKYTYKSDAEDIKDTFGLSKKAFKATLTKLINDSKITLEDEGIRLK